MIDSYRSDLKYNGVSIKLINTDEMLLTVKSKSDQICVIQLMKSWGYPANLTVSTIITLHSEKFVTSMHIRVNSLQQLMKSWGYPAILIVSLHYTTPHTERILSLISTRTHQVYKTTFLNNS